MQVSQVCKTLATIYGLVKPVDQINLMKDNKDTKHIANERGGNTNIFAIAGLRTTVSCALATQTEWVLLFLDVSKPGWAQKR